ncbi:MAG: hypothetical protein H7Y02_04330 [Candidatus Obscuribacterales bacterium]|nr:hypothetical protein [Steroidobacteraceae bacterium]
MKMDSRLRALLPREKLQQRCLLDSSFPRRRESSEKCRCATNLELDARRRGHDYGDVSSFFVVDADAQFSAAHSSTLVSKTYQALHSEHDAIEREADNADREHRH